MTHEEYIEKLAECERLCGLDPDPETADGLQLQALSDELEIYEKEHFAGSIGQAHPDEEEAEGPAGEEDPRGV